MSGLNLFPANFPAGPEIFIASMILLLMLLDAFIPAFNSGSSSFSGSSSSPNFNKKTGIYWLSQLTLIIAFILTLSQWHGLLERSGFSHALIIFNQQFVLDPLACLLKLALYLLAFLSFCYGRAYNNQSKIPVAEYHLLGLLSLLGGMVLISAHSLLTLYLGLELMSLPLYALIAIARRRQEGSEAAMKYFVMGAIASGLLLYGMSLIYGMAGSINLNIISNLNLNTPDLNIGVLITGLVLVLIGMVFKLGIVPFHMWAPDVYEGSPISVTTFLSTVPKIAIFGMICRLVLQGFSHWSPVWDQVFIILGVLSVFIGNLIALTQTNIKRLLAYSTIANMGFVLISLGMGVGEGAGNLGAQSALLYLLIYLLTTAGAFGVLLLMSKGGLELQTIQDFKGLNKRNSWISFIFTLLLLSMAGIPPLLGFDAKLFIIFNLINLNHEYLAVFLLIMSVAASFYYLKIIKAMYFEEPSESASPIIKSAVSFFSILSLNSLLVLILGIFPSGLFWLVSQIF